MAIIGIKIKITKSYVKTPDQKGLKEAYKNIKKK